MTDKEYREHVERLAATRAATIRYAVSEVCVLLMMLALIGSALYCCKILVGL